MPKYKPLTDMVTPDIKSWKLVAENTKASFQKHMPKEYQSKPYSKSYKEAKTTGRIMRPTDRKTGEVKKSGVSQVSFSAKPDLTLTGNMLKEIVATSTGNSAKLEFQNGQKVKWADEGGKYPMFNGDDPASKDVNKDIEKYINKLYDKRVKAQSQKIVYRV